MRHRLKLGATFAAIGVGVAGFVACVGDSTVPGDGGEPDATQNDVVSPPVDAKADSITPEAGPPAPTPDGSIVWLNHFNNNVDLGQRAFTDLAANENSGLTFVVTGEFATDPNAGNQFHFGTINLGPATSYDLVSGGLGSTGSSVWATSPHATAAGGASNIDRYESIAVDANGDVYVFGQTASATLALKTTLTGPTSFVAKLSAAGAPIWNHAFSQNGGIVNGPSVIALAGGNLVVAITYKTSLTYDTTADANASISQSDGGSDSNVFISALDPATGATKWVGSYGSSSDDNVTAIASTPQGDVVLTGIMNDTMTGLKGQGMPLASAVDVGDAGPTGQAYVLKVDASGNAVYGLAHGAASSSVNPQGIAYRNGVIAVAAQFYGAVDFGKGVYTATGSDGVVFTVDETTKKTTFAAQLTGSASDGFTSVALDPWNEIIAAGYYGDQNASAQLGAQPLPQTSISVGAMVLAKWDATGKMLWAHGYVPTLQGGGAPYSTSAATNVHQSIVPTRVVTTSSGQIVVTGTMTGGADFGTGYKPQVSTMAYPQCTCVGAGKFNACIIDCITFPPQACCSTQLPGRSADGIVGAWQP